MKISILLTHWPRYVSRFQYFTQVIGSLKAFLPRSTTQHTFQYFVGLETHECHSEALLNAALNFCDATDVLPLWHEAPPSLAGNFNNAVAYLNTDYFIYVQDDFTLRRELVLDTDIAYMESHKDVGVIRYNAGGSSLASSKVLEGEDLYTLRELVPDCPYYWSDQPYLMRKSVMEFYGPYPESTRDVIQEVAMNKQVKKAVREGNQGRILVRGYAEPRQARHPFFFHVGNESSMTEKIEAAEARKARQAAQADNKGNKSV